MQPRTHELFLRAGLAGQPRRELDAWLDALLAGNRDEDSYVWPILGWRTPSLGLSHTCRPGRRRGELGAPSARDRCASLIARAHARRRRGDDRGAATLFGRAAHLVGDAAVPARARGVWHIFGDPLERWVEAHLGAPIAAATRPSARDAAALVESLAVIASTFPVSRRGARPAPAELERQAQVLVPQAIAHVAALLELWSEARPSPGTDDPRIAESPRNS